MATVPLRIKLLAPPKGVLFSRQNKAGEIVDPKMSDGSDLSFDFSVEFNPGPRGPFVMGPAGAKFFYICCGTSAGQFNSPWTRRAKIPIAGITEDLLADRRPEQVLEFAYPGTAKDGGPTCATVKVPGEGWRAV